MTLIDPALLTSLQTGGRAKKGPMSNTLTAFDDAIAILAGAIPSGGALASTDVFPIPGTVESSSGAFTLDWAAHFAGPRFVTLARATGDATEGLTATLPEIPLGHAAPVRITEEVAFTAPSRTFTVAADWTDDMGAGQFTITEAGVTTSSLGLVAGDAVSGGPLGAPTTISEIVSDSVFKTVATAGETDSGSIDIVAPACSIDGVREFTSPDPTGSGGGVLMVFVPLAASSATARGEIKTGERYDRALALAEDLTYAPGETLPEGWLRAQVLIVPESALSDLGPAGEDPRVIIFGVSSPSAGDPEMLSSPVIITSGTTAVLSGIDTSKIAAGSRIIALAGCRKGDDDTTGAPGPALSALSISGGSTFDGAATLHATDAADIVSTESFRASTATCVVDTVAGATFTLTATFAASIYQAIVFFFIVPESALAGTGKSEDGISFDYTALDSFSANDLFFSLAGSTGSSAIAAPADSGERNNAASGSVLQVCAGWHREDPTTWTATPSRVTAQQAIGVAYRPT